MAMSKSVSGGMFDASEARQHFFFAVFVLLRYLSIGHLSGHLMHLETPAWLFH